MTEERICQSCQAQFSIAPEDFDFYQKIGVPPPTWCPTCRNIRRMAWREAGYLYHGVCAMCGKKTISVYPPGNQFTVYCRECYRSDKWDPLSYGSEYNFAEPFFAQYRELMEKVPRTALTGTDLTNSEFSHGSQGLKDCYSVIWSYYCQDSQNCSSLLMSRDAYDSYITDNSDHIYECLHSNRLYRTSFGYFSDECLDSAFLYNCLGCSDCFGCVNLRKKKYCLFNEQLTKEEYRARRVEWDLGSFRKLTEAQEKFRALYLATPQRYAHILNGQNVTGDVIRDAKNCQTCFSALDGVENCKYLYFGGLNLKDSMDISAGGDMAELLYEVFGVTSNASRCYFCAGGGNCRNTYYCDWATNSSDLFGCVSLKNKKYCILNKQYSKEEYESLLPKIKQQMMDAPYVDQKGRIYKFGEFFPTELSAYAYNESWAFPWYPLAKQKVLSEGWRWQEPSERSYTVTLFAEDLPDHIQDVPDSIVQETIRCAGNPNSDISRCATAFRITPQELAFYRDMNLALPRSCPACRYFERLKWRKGFILYHRKCQQAGCQNEFETAFSPDSPEIIYCESCYRAEFL